MSATRYLLGLALVATPVLPVRAASPEAPPGASSCTGCHAVRKGTDTAVPPLAGRKQPEIVEMMAAFSTGQRPATVMGRIAKGFMPAEIEAIAAWFAQQEQ